MKTPWEILNIDAETATKKEAKRAYARLLKQNRPDEKPDEFQKIREAYDTVCYFLQEKEWQADFESSHAQSPELKKADSEDSSQNPQSNDSEIEDSPNQLPVAHSIEFSESIYPELDQLFDEVVAASISEDTENLEQAFSKGTVFTRDFPDSIERWGNKIVESSHKVRNEIGSLLKTEDLIFELENDCRSLSDLFVQKHHRESNFDELCFLQKTFEIEKHRLTSPVAAAFLIDLARRIAIVVPNASSKLLDLAYPNLAPGYRHFAASQVEFQIGQGKMFSNHLIQKRRAFWDARAHDEEFERDFDWWEDEEAREEIAILSRAGLPEDIQRELLDLLPEDLRKMVTQKIANADEQRELDEAADRGQRFQSSDNSWKSQVKMAVAVLVVVIVLAIAGHKAEQKKESLPNESDIRLMLEDLPNKALPQFALIPENKEPEFTAPLHLADRDTHPIIKNPFDPVSLRSPEKGLTAGSTEHLALLEMAASNKAIDLEHRLTIPDIIAELGDPKEADDILQRLQNADIEEEIRNRALLNRVTIKF